MNGGTTLTARPTLYEFTFYQENQCLFHPENDSQGSVQCQWICEEDKEHDFHWKKSKL